MNKYLFDNWHQWKVCFLSGCSKAIWGIGRIITCLLFGILSIIRYLWRLFVAFVRQNPAIAIVGFIIIIILTWLLTFMQMRARTVGAEHQRDSISYELSKYTQMYDSSTVVLIHDSILKYDSIHYE